MKDFYQESLENRFKTMLVEKFFHLINSLSSQIDDRCYARIFQEAAVIIDVRDWRHWVTIILNQHTSPPSSIKCRGEYTSFIMMLISRFCSHQYLKLWLALNLIVRHYSRCGTCKTLSPNFVPISKDSVFNSNPENLLILCEDR